MTQVMHMYRLLKAADTEVENNFLKHIIKAKNVHLWLSVDKQ